MLWQKIMKFKMTKKGGSLLEPKKHLSQSQDTLYSSSEDLRPKVQQKEDLATLFQKLSKDLHTMQCSIQTTMTNITAPNGLIMQSPLKMQLII